MGKYPLGPLLSVREYREEAASNAVRTAETAVREAETAELEAQKALEDYRVWRVEEEERRYAAIMDQVLSLEELDDFKSGLAVLINGETKQEENVESARRRVEQCRVAVQKAQDNLKTARKETSKILAHKDLWLVEAKKEAEHAEDLEMEDFKPLPPQGSENIEED